MKENKLKKYFSVLGVLAVLISLIGLFGCQKAAKNTDCEQSSWNKTTEGVQVKRGRLTPTLSGKSNVSRANPFVIVSPQQGEFIAKIESGVKVKKGTVLGTVGNVELVTPVDATIISVEETGEYPKNYPLFTMQYVGFALNLDAEYFLRELPANSILNGKFQIQDGIGPEDAIAVVMSETSNSEDQGMTYSLQCMISQDVEVKEGQLATVVVTAETKEDVLLLPISVVAGRVKQGSVTLISDGDEKKVQVELGASDGAYIEIISGLNEGDKVSAVPPNLDLRNN